MSTDQFATFLRDIEGDRIDLRVTAHLHAGKRIGVRVLTGDAGIQFALDDATARALAATLIAAVESKA